jgi:hypothetical protein
MAHLGDRLLVNGALKQRSEITVEVIRPVFALLELVDGGPADFDPVLRRASGSYRNLEFDQVTGFSGSPVFNSTTKKLAGMVVRGGMQEGSVSLLYVDIIDILEVMKAQTSGAMQARYDKTIARSRLAIKPAINPA